MLLFYDILCNTAQQLRKTKPQAKQCPWELCDSTKYCIRTDHTI